MQQFQPEPTQKFTNSSRSMELKGVFPRASQIIMKNSGKHRNQHRNNHKLYNEMGHPVLSLMENQWKLRQQHDQNFPIEGKP